MAFVRGINLIVMCCILDTPSNENDDDGAQDSLEKDFE